MVVKKFLVTTAGCVLVIIFLWIILFNFLYPLRYRQEIKNAATMYNIEPCVIAALINVESSFDKNQVSPKNAVGLMQILPATATYITNNAENIDLFDAQTNIQIGTKYLAYLIEKFQDLDTALFAYNAGEGNVARWLDINHAPVLRTCPFPETNNYVAKIKRTLKFYRGRI